MSANDHFYVTEPVFSLEKKVLERLGRTSGNVEFHNVSINLGFCETCDYPVDGFSVTVDSEQVWPSDEVIAEVGGYATLDEEGFYDEGRESLRFTKMGDFFLWLSGMTGAEILEHHDREWEEYALEQESEMLDEELDRASIDDQLVDDD